MEKKWTPCICTIVIGILVVVFAWWNVSWGAIALTVLGALAVIHGLVGKCCCADYFSKKGEGSSCCT